MLVLASGAILEYNILHPQNNESPAVCCHSWQLVHGNGRRHRADI